MLEFAAMNTFKPEWLLVYLYEALLFLWLYKPMLYPVQRISLIKRILLPILVLLYVLLKWKWESYIVPNMLVMILYGVIILWLYSDIERRNVLWLSTVFTVCVELGRILVYGSIYITGNVELYDKHHWLLRIIAQFLKWLPMHFCKKSLCEYARKKIGYLDYLLVSLAIVQLIFMHQRRRISISYPENIAFEVETFLTLGFGVFLILVAIIYQMKLAMKEERLQKIRTAMNDTYLNTRRQQEVDKETRRLYHDLKHQLQAIGSLGEYTTEEARAQLVQELFQQVTNLDIQVDSANPLLDSLLRQKIQNAHDKKINMELYLDPISYDFLDKMDMCSIFGNALDNAIEAVSLIKEPEKRWIRLKSTVIQGIWVLKTENHYKIAPRKENGVFLTTKADSLHHGIGISSIQYCADKYKGKLNIKTDDGIFSLVLTIPLP